MKKMVETPPASLDSPKLWEHHRTDSTKWLTLWQHWIIFPSTAGGEQFNSPHHFCRWARTSEGPMLSQTLLGSISHPTGVMSYPEGPLVKCGFGVFSSILRARKQSQKLLLSNTAHLSKSLPAPRSRVGKKHIPWQHFRSWTKGKATLLQTGMFPPQMNSAWIVILVTYLYKNIHVEDGSEILGKPRGRESAGLYVALLHDTSIYFCPFC